MHSLATAVHFPRLLYTRFTREMQSEKTTANLWKRCYPLICMTFIYRDRKWNKHAGKLHYHGFFSCSSTAMEKLPAFDYRWNIHDWFRVVRQDRSCCSRRTQERKSFWWNPTYCLWRFSPATTSYQTGWEQKVLFSGKSDTFFLSYVSKRRWKIEIWILGRS